MPSTKARALGPGQKIGTSLYPSSVTIHDNDAAKSWTQAFFMSLSIATFAFVGVEITAASALEACVPTERAARSSTIRRTIKFSAVYISFLTACLYVLAGFLVTLNLNWNHEQLPRMSWVKVKETNENLEAPLHQPLFWWQKSLRFPGLLVQ
jgi:amino acid transporter